MREPGSTAFARREGIDHEHSQIRPLLRGVRHRRCAVGGRQERLAGRDVPKSWPDRACASRTVFLPSPPRRIATCWMPPAPGNRCMPNWTISTRPTSPRWHARPNVPGRSSTAPGFPMTWPPRSSRPTAGSKTSTGGTRSVWLCGRRRPPRTCRPRASPASRTPISTSRAKRASSMRAAGVSRACSPIAPFTTASIRVSISSRSRCRSA